MPTTITLDVSSFSKMEKIKNNSNNSSQYLTKYFALVKVQSIWKNREKIDKNYSFNCFALNPRKQNINTDLCKNIKNSLLNNDNFCSLNKGILFSVSSIKKGFINNSITFNLEDESLHGNIDGGHTLRIIFELKEEEIETIKNKCVSFEFITGLKDEKMAKALSDSRNSVVNLDTSSSANFLGHFDELKKVMSMKTLAKIEERITYGRNDGLDLSKDIKKIPIAKMIILMNIFNKSMHDVYGIFQLTSDSASERTFLEIYSDKKMAGDLLQKIDIWDKIFWLWDQMEVDLIKNLCGNEEECELLIDKSFFCPKINEVKTEFYQENQLKYDGKYYSISKSFMLPIFNSFNCLIDETKNGNEWKVDPLFFWNLINKKVIRKAYEYAEDDFINNANRFGKKREFLENIRNLVNNEYYKYKSNLQE